MSSELEPLLVYGSGGHAKVIIDSIEKSGKYRIHGLIDDDESKKGASVFGYLIKLLSHEAIRTINREKRIFFIFYKLNY